MKIRSIVALSLLFLGLGVAPCLHAREEMSLNGTWQVQYAADADKAPQGEWREVDVPSMLSMRRDTPHVWYRRAFTVPESMRGKHLTLKFTGVKFVSKVWVNGKEAGSHYGGWEPFELSVTRLCKAGENHLLVRATDVRGVIDEKLDPSKLKKGQRFVEMAKDSVMAPIGSRTGDVGIWEDVSLAALDDVFADDVFIKTSVRKKRIDVDITLRNLGKADRTVRLKAHVLDGEATALAFDEQDITVPAGGTKTVTISKPWESPKLWSHLSPHLYHLVTAVAGDGREMDALKTRFGFREFWIDGIHFVLNGKRINFLATAGHPPTTSDAEMAKRYYQGMRDANCVAVRLHANLWPSWWFDAADEFGMLVVQETAVWCFPRNYALSKPAFWENYRRHLSGMFKRDKNHPSIMFYSLENEILHCGGDRLPETEQNLADIGLFMKKLDPTRPIMYDADGDPKGVTDVINLHYTHEFPLYNMFPDTCYWVDETYPVRWKWLGDGEWKWDRKKPLYMGEFMWSPAKTPAPYALFLGDEAYPDFRMGRARAKAMAWRFQVEAFRQEELAGMCPWTLMESRGFPQRDTAMFEVIQRAYQPNAAFVREYDSRFYSGESVKRTVYLYNDTFADAKLTLSWVLKKGGQVVDSRQKEFTATPAQKIDTDITLKIPEVTDRTALEFVVKVKNGDRLAFEDTYAYWAFPRHKPQITGKGRIAVFSGAGVAESVLDEAGAAYTKVADLTQPIDADLLIIGANALDRIKTKTDMPTVGDDATVMQRLADFTAKGGTILVMEQAAYPSGVLPAGLAKKGCTIAFKQAFHHPALKRVQEGDFKFWRGDHVVARDAVAKPRTGSFVTLCNASAEGGMIYCPLIEIRNGRGRCFLSQLLLAEKMETEPMAQIIFEDLVNMALTAAPPEAKLAVVQEKMDLVEDLTTVGASYEDISGKLAAADLSAFAVLLVEADAKEAADNCARLREFAEKGGKILLHGGTAEGLAKLKGLLPPLGLSRSSGVPVTIAKRAPWIDGLSNHDLYWLGKPTGQRHAPIPPTPEIIDCVVTPGLPDAAQCKTIEAEAMELGVGEPRHTEDGAALHRRGDVFTDIEFSETGEYTFAVRAKGTPLEKIYPQVALRIDGKRAAVLMLSGPEWQTYVTSATVEQGKRRVSLAFTNDGWDPATGEDRNLFLDKMTWARSPTIPGERILSPAALTVVSIGKGGCLIDQVNWHGRTGGLDKAARYLANLLTNLGVTFAQRPPALAIAGGAMQRGEDSAVNRMRGKIAYLGSNGSVFANVKFIKARKYVFEVDAQGTEAEGEFPIVRLLIDDKKIAERQIKRSGWGILRYEVDVPAGEHKVTLEFINDLWKPPADRNLQIGRLAIR